MTDEELTTLETLAAAATAGPWSVQYTGGSVYVDHCGRVSLGLFHCAGQRADENARFIAHARTDVPALVAEVRRLRAEVDAAWEATGVASTVRGLTTLADVVATHRAEVLAGRQLAAAVRAERSARAAWLALRFTAWPSPPQALLDAEEATRRALGEVTRG